MAGGKEHVVVLGGGFAGLETAFLLKHRLHDQISITIVSDEADFLFRPNTIYIPFGLDPDELRIPLGGPTSKQGIDFVHARVEDVDPTERLVRLAGRDPLPYDRLVIGTGASMRPSEVPGLAEHANTIWTPMDMLALGQRLREIVERGKDGTVTRLLFLIPPNNKCSGPLYEMVQMVETHLRREGVRESVEITWTSSESAYIQAFGPKIHEVVEEEFHERHIDGRLQWVVDRVLPDRVLYTNGEEVSYDVLVAFPPYVAALEYGALPHDDRGFLNVEHASRAVLGHPNIYAPGDAGDFPVKQAFLAFLQADAAAEAIVSEVLQKEPRVTFDAVSMCVMEQFDKATFAQVPLRLTGDPARPVEVRPGAEDEYKVGVSPLWRMGKKLLGVYLPMRFRAGEPFHAGTAWTMMEVGLKGMSGVLAQ
jgi:NADH dehydrogenase FAD-containing subunit